MLAACGVIRYCWGPAAAKAQVSAEPAAPIPPLRRRPTILPAPRRLPAARRRRFPAACRFPTSWPRSTAIPSAATSWPWSVASTTARKCWSRWSTSILILAECRQMGITISRREVDEEIEQMAKSFNLPVEQWMKLLCARAGNQARAVCQRHHLAQPGVAETGGREVARSRQKELTEAFEMEYGAAVKVRLIVCTTAGEGPEGPGPRRGQSGRVRQPGQSSIRKTRPAPASRAWSRRSASMAPARKSKRPPSDWPTARFPESSAARANT